MNATVGGTPGGIQSGDAITKIEIVWKSGAETEAQAQSAGRAVTLTAAGDITAFQSGTYTLSSANLVSWQTYTPAVRVTESRSGVDGFVGGWRDSAVFTAQGNDILLAEFDTTTLPSALTVGTEAGVTYDSNVSNAGYLTATSINTSSLSLGYFPLPANKIFKIKVKGRVDYAAGGPTFLGLYDGIDGSGGSFLVTTYVSTYSSGSYNSSLNVTMMQYKTPSATFNSWHPSGQLTGSFSSAGGFGMSNNEFVYQLESNGTQLRTTIYANDGTTIIYQSAWLNWSSVIAPVNQLVFGCSTGGGQCKMYLDYIRITVS